ncbi:MAG: pyridoxamine 5'-phosphate oxidase family protein [Mycobacteriales bacterium]
MTPTGKSGHDFDPSDVLRKPLVAHLATVAGDGAPRHSPVWFLWEDGEIWLIGTTTDSFPRRLRADPRCAIGVVDFDLRDGTLRHVGLRGVAEIVPLDPGRLYRLLSRYLGPDAERWDAEFRADVIDHLDLMIRFVPQTVVARDQSIFGRPEPAPERVHEEGAASERVST